MKSPIAFLNARLIDPATGLDETGGLITFDGKIAECGPDVRASEISEVIDCKGKILCPGLVDMRVYTGEPGTEHRETLASASAAAAAGGVTTIAVMPNTEPVIDGPALVDFIRRRADATAKVRIAPLGALTKGLEGKVMTEMGLMMEAGAVAFTDGDRSISNTKVLQRTLSYAATFGALTIAHAEDPDLSAGESMTSGMNASHLGLPAAPAAAEVMIVERDIRLVEMTGARYHFGQISTKAALEAIIAAKARGLPITCGVSAHHLMLTDADVGPYYTFMKVKPPLRSEGDRLAMVEGVKNGDIDVIVSSHDPQAADTKRQPFPQAAFGAVGLETLLPVALELAAKHDIPLAHILKCMTRTPAQLLGLPAGTLAKGAAADLTLIDPAHSFTVTQSMLHSKAKNTAFDGHSFPGRAIASFVGGNCVFDLATEQAA